MWKGMLPKMHPVSPTLEFGRQFGREALGLRKAELMRDDDQLDVRAGESLRGQAGCDPSGGSEKNLLDSAFPRGFERKAQGLLTVARTGLLVVDDPLFHARPLSRDAFQQYTAAVSVTHQE